MAAFREFYWAIGAPTIGTEENPEQVLSVYIVRVFEADIDTSGFRDEARRSQVSRDAADAFVSARETAEGILPHLLAWVRTDQSWLGLSTEPLEVEGISELRDMAADARLPIGVPHRIGPILIPSLASALTESRVINLWSRVVDRVEAPTAETLLADAEHFAWAAPPDPVRAVLMAAIAAEVKVKSNLRAKIDPAQAPLLDFILESPREITVTAADTLFDKLMKITQGRSLRECDRSLFNEIKQLFKVRNDIAHRGQVPALEEGEALTRAARRAFHWLDASEALR